MSRMIDIEYSAQNLIQNCQEELARIRGDINSAKRKLEALDSKGGFGKLFHLGEIKRRKESLQIEIKELERKERIVKKEQEYYQRFGTKIPEGEAGKEMRKLLEARQEKLDILTMIDCGLM